MYYSHSVSKLSPNIIPVLFDEIMQQIHSKPTKFINFCPIELQIDVLFFYQTYQELQQSASLPRVLVSMTSSSGFLRQICSWTGLTISLLMKNKNMRMLAKYGSWDLRLPGPFWVLLEDDNYEFSFYIYLSEFSVG